MNDNTPLSIHRLASYFAERDPGSGITESAIRRLIKSGEIRSCRIGAKYMPTPAAVMEFYEGGRSENYADQTGTGIRRLPVILDN